MTSISSDDFKSQNINLQTAQEQSSYRARAHFTVKDKAALKQDYEDFFASTPVAEDDKVDEKKKEDDYDYYEE